MLVLEPLDILALNFRVIGAMYVCLCIGKTDDCWCYDLDCSWHGGES